MDEEVHESTSIDGLFMCDTFFFKVYLPDCLSILESTFICYSNQSSAIIIKSQTECIYLSIHTSASDIRLVFASCNYVHGCENTHDKELAHVSHIVTLHHHSAALQYQASTFTAKC